MFTIINKNKQKGFTLIEMLVSVALFSVVLVVTLGSILTIMDSNKKARSLMSVMNNLNFSIDSMTRSIKAGEITGASVTSGGSCFETSQINYDAEGFAREDVKYCLVVVNGIGKIEKTVQGINPSAITAPDVDIDYLKFTEYIISPGNQPRISIVIEGTAKVSEKISSNFTIQTTVAQRKLNL